MNTRFVRLAAACLMMLASAQAAAVTPYKAEYKALIKLIPVQVDITLRSVGRGEYAFKSDIHTRSWASLFGGNVVETSLLTGVRDLHRQGLDLLAAVAARPAEEAPEGGIVELLVRLVARAGGLGHGVRPLPEGVVAI